MADKDNENTENTTEEVVETNETVSEDAVEVEESSEASAEAVDETPATDDVLSDAEPETEELSAEEAPEEEVQTAPITVDEKSPAQIINAFESNQLKADIPSFRPGDTVVVSVKVQEGDRTRLQAFEGVVMNIKKAGLNSAFIVRKISSGEGVERVFPLFSNIIESIERIKTGDVRRAKLYYLRNLSGKKARISERTDGRSYDETK